MAIYGTDVASSELAKFGKFTFAISCMYSMWAYTNSTVTDIFFTCVLNLQNSAILRIKHQCSINPTLSKPRGANRGVQGCKVFLEQLIGVSWGRNQLTRLSLLGECTQPKLTERLEMKTIYQIHGSDNHHHSKTSNTMVLQLFAPKGGVCGLKSTRFLS